MDTRDCSPYRVQESPSLDKVGQIPAVDHTSGRACSFSILFEIFNTSLYLAGGARRIKYQVLTAIICRGLDYGERVTPELVGQRVYVYV